ncbi:MAG TPA: protein kinase [Vicinamibacterales bacterium]|jgi:serine/threonine protein kinase/Tol biopolymer transport system component|nr:protein kinase [Vicinamibacterales bacterium]
MPLTPGTRIGPYEIVGLLGAGGMGEVYRARDTKLGRDVALKVLPPLVANDPDRLARFRREAQVLASLNDPHIAQIHGFEDSGGTHALVMELVDGPTLAERIAAASGHPEPERVSARPKDTNARPALGSPQPSGPGVGPRPLRESRAPSGLNIDDALSIARQIASALDTAHEHGIVHRDLKPANVKVREDGTVKVLDFGLAKALAPAGELSPDAANSPTMSAHATEMGMILGTAAYMAPEQARGRSVDKRADIWAFGVVLFEMLTGRQLFTGETISDTLAAVLRQEIDWTTLPADTPVTVQRLLRRCLDRDPKRRLRDIGEATIALDTSDDPLPTASVSASAARGTRRLALVVAGGVLMLAGAAAGAGALWWWHGRTGSTSGPTLRLSILPPADRPLFTGGTPSRSLAISPDGTRIVYVASGPDVSETGSSRTTQLEIRSLASRTIHDIAGTQGQGAKQPFFSPDGQWVAFFTNTGDLRKVSLAGGSAITLASKINGSQWSFGVWLRDGTIVFSSVDGLHRVSAEGGTVSTLLAKGQQEQEQGAIASLTSTASEHAVLLEFVNPGNVGVSTARIEAVRLDTGIRTLVLDHAASPLVTPDGRHLLFERDGALLAAPFDDAMLAVTGPVIPLVDDIGADTREINPTAEWTMSATGTLAYIAATDRTSAMGMVDRAGTFRPLAVPRGVYRLPRVSPDGRTIAFTTTTPQQSEIDLFDLARGSLAKLPASGSESAPAWTPDGQALAVTAATSNAAGIAFADLTGGLRMLVTSKAGELLRNGSFSPDGTELAYTRQTGSPHDIWVLTLGHPPPVPYLDSAAAEHSPQFSPDGHWLAYVSDESGHAQVYIHGYPRGPRFVVSIDGGEGPVWRRDGREIFFESGSLNDRHLMAAAVTPDGDRLRLGTPVPLFALRSADANGTIEQYAPSTNAGAEYDVMPDGQHFVMLRHAEPPLEIVVVPHWLDGLAATRSR